MYSMYVLCIDKERFSVICFIFLSLFFLYTYFSLIFMDLIEERNT